MTDNKNEGDKGQPSLLQQMDETSPVQQT